MTVDEYIKQQKHKLKKFKEYWIHGNKTQDDIFPLDMPNAEWDEQFYFFDDEIYSTVKDEK